MQLSEKIRRDRQHRLREIERDRLRMEKHERDRAEYERHQRRRSKNSHHFDDERIVEREIIYDRGGSRRQW